MLNALPLLALLLFPASAIAGQAPLDDAFDPRAYPKKKATCRAVDRNGSPAPGDYPTKEIEIHYVDVNPEAERTLLLVHGWPSLWSTWSNQIQRFGKDYRLIIPDLRGFGPSTHPGDVEASGTIGDLVGDLVCVLENEKIDKSICVGHDWGAQLCWEGARMRPDVFDAVAGAVVPYLPSAGPFTPVEQLAAYLPKLSYQTYFEKHTQEAIKELDTDIRRTLRGTLRSAVSPPPDKYLLSTTDFLKAWSAVPEIPPIPFMSQIEEDYLVEQYKIQGFGKTLQFYTYGNRYGSWDFSHSQANFSIPQPALYIAPLHDPVADWVLASRIVHSADFIPNLKLETLPGHHWPQLEHPQEFNEILANWLATLHLPESSTTAEESSQETQETARQHQEL